MYKAVYDQMASDTADVIRRNERKAFDRCLELLRLAEEKGRGSRESVEALLFTSRLWSILLEDLASDGNGLPERLRASLISIGIWVLRQTEEIRQGSSAGFANLIEVTRSIRDGLRRT